MLRPQQFQATIRQLFPHGGLLPAKTWKLRHRGILVLLWLHVIGFTAYALLAGANLVWHDLTEVLAIAVLAALASWRRNGRTSRTLFASAGLIACSALLVHLSDGLIEFHFHFFVAVAVIALYESWAPFLLALAYILFDHGVVGTLAPGLVFNHPDAAADPWKWALIHDVFVLAPSTASVAHWRLNEVERERASHGHVARIEAQTAQRQTQTLAEQALLLDLTQDSMFVWELESGAIRFWNRGAEEMYGWRQDEVLGRTPQQILRTEFPRPLSELRESLERTGRWEGELIHHCRDGSVVPVMSRWALKVSADGQPQTALAINTNITEHKRAQAELERQAQHDGLTGLPNRTSLSARLDDTLTRAANDATPVALLMLDLDRFKDVNDTLGHASGDRLLCAVGPHLRTHLRQGDMLARLGGDEFAVLLPDADAAAAQLVARKLLDVLEQPFDLGDATVNIAG